MTNEKLIGKSKLPLRSADPINTVDLKEALEVIKRRPDILFDDAEERELDVAALQIGIELRRARLRKGLTQEELAALTGIGQGAISAIERGRGKDGPSFRIVRDIARALDSTVILKSANPVSVVECKAISETPGSLAFQKGFEDSLNCWAFVETITTEADLSAITEKIISTYTDDTQFLEPAACGLWRMVARSSARITASTEMLVVSTSPSGGVRPKRSDFYSGGYFTMAIGEIEVTNDSSNPIGLITVPMVVAGRALQQKDR